MDIPVSHPWRILSRFIKWKGITQKEFADLIDKSASEINLIINAQKSINPDFAIRFSIVFWTSAEVWLWMQQAYDVYQMKKSSRNEWEYANIQKRIANFSIT